MQSLRAERRKLSWVKNKEKKQINNIYFEAAHLDWNSLPLPSGHMKNCWWMHFDVYILFSTELSISIYLHRNAVISIWYSVDSINCLSSLLIMMIINTEIETYCTFFSCSSTSNERQPWKLLLLRWARIYPNMKWIDPFCTVLLKVLMNGDFDAIDSVVLAFCVAACNACDVLFGLNLLCHHP